MRTLRLYAPTERERARETIRLGSPPRGPNQTLVLHRPAPFVRPVSSGEESHSFGHEDGGGDWGRLLGEHTWRTLAVVAADARSPTHLVADLLAMTGRSRGETIGVADLHATSRRDTFQDVLAYHLGRGERVVFAAPAHDEPIARSVVHAVDLVVLVLTLGWSSRRAIRDAVDSIGSDRLAGCVVLRPRGGQGA